jgi:dienelactone hydrolase
MAGSDITCATRNGERFDGYLAAPAGNGRAPGILHRGPREGSRGAAAMMGRHLDEVGRITCPVSFHYGDADPVVPMDEVRAAQQAFAGRASAEIRVYPGAGHNFAMPRKEGYHPAAARSRATGCCAAFSPCETR